MSEFVCDNANRKRCSENWGKVEIKIDWVLFTHFANDLRGELSDVCTVKPLDSVLEIRCNAWKIVLGVGFDVNFVWRFFLFLLRFVFIWIINVLVRKHHSNIRVAMVFMMMFGVQSQHREWHVHSSYSCARATRCSIPYTRSTFFHWGPCALMLSYCN